MVNLKTSDLTAGVHCLGTRGASVIALGCKCPVRDWKLSSDTIPNDRNRQEFLSTIPRPDFKVLLS
jgi:hypothetical protein